MNFRLLLLRVNNMPKKKTTRKTTKRRKPPYSLEVEVNDTTFKTNAKSMTEALTKFVESPEFPLGPKTVTLVRYSKGRNKGRQVWHTPRARRLFRQIALKSSALEVLGAKMQEELNA